MPDRPGSIQSSTTRSGRAFLEPGVGLVAARGGLDLVAFGLEVVAEQHGERLFVLDDQNARAHALRPRYLIAGRAQRGDRRGVALRPLVGDRPALDDVVHRLGDVGGVVAHALDVLGAEQQMDAERDVARIFHHIGEQLAEHRGADRVDFLVAAPHRHRLAVVAAGIGIEHRLHLAEHQIGHVFDAADQLGRREFAVERDHALGDVLGEIADALQIVGEPQRADDFAQIDRHRLAAGDGQHRLFLDLALQRVDIGIGLR